MVICNKYNFIFLRIPKNASTSLATWFIKNCCSENDRFTKVNDSGINNTNISPKVIAKHLPNYHFIHMTLQELIDDEVITKNEALTKRVIGVFRNPLHRQLSLFFFLGGDKSPERFREVFKNGCHQTDPSNKITQTEYLKINGVIYPNCKVWKYDNINNELNNFKTAYMPLGYSDDEFPLKKYKSNKRPNDIIKLENQYYDDYTRKAVREYYREDFKLLELE